MCLFLFQIQQEREQNVHTDQSHLDALCMCDLHSSLNYKTQTGKKELHKPVFCSKHGCKCHITVHLGILYFKMCTVDVRAKYVDVLTTSSIPSPPVCHTLHHSPHCLEPQEGLCRLVFSQSSRGVYKVSAALQRTGKGLSLYCL